MEEEGDLLKEQEERELCAAANMNLGMTVVSLQVLPSLCISLARQETNIPGAHYVLSKQMQKGESYLRKATELDPHDGEIRYNLAATLAAMGKIEAAITEFEMAEERGIEIAGQVAQKLREGLKENAERGEK